MPEMQITITVDECPDYDNSELVSFEDIEGRYDYGCWGCHGCNYWRNYEADRYICDKGHTQTTATFKRMEET
jgi:hypothetical protein